MQTHAKLQGYFFFALLLGILVISFFILKPFANALIVAMVLAILFRPVFDRIVKKGAGKTLSALATVLIVIIVVLTPLTFFGAKIFSDARESYLHIIESDNPLGFLHSLADRVEIMFPDLVPNDVHQKIDDAGQDSKTYLQNGAIWLVKNLGVYFSSILRFVLALFIGILALYYLLRDGDLLLHKLVQLSPLADKYDNEIAHKLKRAVDSVIRGVIVIAVVQAILTGIGFAIFGIPNAILWGGVAMIGALVPGIGTAIVIVPGVLYLFATGHAGAAIGLIAWGILAVGLVDNFLSPKLIGKGIRVHSFLVLLFVLGGIVLFGPIGIILGPLALALLLALLDIYELSFEGLNKA